MRLLVVVVCALLVFAGVASAQTDTPLTDQVKDCDLLAGHPADPERMAEGVTDDRIVPRLAIMACEQAVQEQPAEARFVFQLGRALLAYNKKAEAAERFEKAAQAGYGAAWAYLGDAYQFGYRGTPDYAKAFDAYGNAVDKGFDRARALLDMMVFDKAVFSIDLLDLVYTGKFSDLTSRSIGDGKWPPRAYLYAFTQKVMGDCEQVLAPATLPSLFRYRYEGWSAETDSSIAVEASAAVADVDGQTFLRRYGCDSPVSKQLFGSLDRFIKGY